jgi:hypothetical protein
MTALIKQYIFLNGLPGPRIKSEREC